MFFVILRFEKRVSKFVEFSQELHQANEDSTDLTTWGLETRREEAYQDRTALCGV